jgi:hypothetical protein
MLEQINALLDRAAVAQGLSRLALLSLAGELLRPLSGSDPLVCEVRCRRAALVLRTTDHRIR